MTPALCFRTLPTQVCFDAVSVVLTTVGGKKKPKEILKGITGRIRPGRMTAVLGSTGLPLAVSSWAYLLQVLENRRSLTFWLAETRQEKLEAQYCWKEHRLRIFSTRLALTCCSTTCWWYRTRSYSSVNARQATQTVKETFTFYGNLHLHLSKKEKKEKVKKLIEILGLSQCKDTLIGNEANRGISGGEMKRVAIGVSLITDPCKRFSFWFVGLWLLLMFVDVARDYRCPSWPLANLFIAVLILDEPTSGLDSYNALALVKVLKTLSQEGITVLCTIHQPSSEIFEVRSGWNSV